MADGTVRGGFELSSEQALRSLTQIRDRGREADAALEHLGRRMDTLSMKRVTPTVELRGLDRVNLQLSELEARLDRLNRRSVTSRVAIGGGLVPGAGGGGQGLVAGGQGSGMFSSLGGIPGRLPLAAAALPLVPQLLGGAGALVGSAGAGALGAGAVGLSGLASLGAGAGLTMAIAKPAVSALGEITKAQEAYNKAVEEFGRRSTQAATAQRNYNQAVVSNPAAAGASRQLGLLRSEFSRATAPARANVFGGISNVLYNARAAVPTVGRAATAATAASAGAASQFSGFLAAPAQQRTLLQLTAAFATELPMAERTLENMVTVFSHLAVAGIPFFHEANVWVEHWTAGLARSTGDTARVQSGMQGLVTSAKDWARLIGAAGRDLRDLFAPSVQPGNSMVVTLTNSLDRWDVWLRNNPDKVRRFFHDGVTGVERIATVIGNLATDVWQIFRALNPILSRAEQFLQFASGLGGGNLLTGAGLLYGAYSGIRGATGRGPSAGGALSSFVLGSPRGLMGGGGGAAAGGGGAAATATIAQRATNLDVAHGFTGSGAILLGGATTGPEAVLARRAAAQAAAADTRAFAGIRGQVANLVEHSPLAARVADAAVSARELALGAFSGVARFVAPLVALNGVLGAVGAHGGAQARLGAGISAMSFGALSPAQATRLTPGIVGALPAAALARVAPGALATGAEGVLGRVIGPQVLGSLGGPVLSALGGAALGGAGAFAGFLASPSIAGTSLGSRQARASMNQIAAQASAVRTPAQLQALEAAAGGAIGRGQVGAEMSPGDQRKLNAFLAHAVSIAAQNAGSQAANTWQNAFTHGVERLGSSRAVRTMLAGMHTQLRELGPQGAKDFASSTARWVRQMEEDNPKLRRPLEKLMDGIVEDMNRLNHHTGTTFRDLQSKIFYFNGQIYTGTNTTWGAIRDSLINKANVAQEKLLGIWGTIQLEAENALKSMGFSQAQAKAIVTETAQGGANAKSANLAVQVAGSGGGIYTPLTTTSGIKKERGGQIGGVGMLDTVPLPDGSTAAPGEAWIANQHTMNDLSSATLAKFGKTAWQMIRDETRPHSAPALYRAPGSQTRRQAGGVSISAALSAPAAGGRGGGGGTGGYVYPLPGFTIGRTDMGVDANAPAGTPILAIGDSTLVGVQQNWYHGQPLLDFRLDSGPDAGKYWYVAEQISPTTEAIGSHFAAGQAVARYASSGTGIEIGWAGNASGSTLAQTTTGYSEGQVTPAGSSFRAFIAGLSHGKLVAGGPGGGAAAAVPQINIKAPRSGLKGMPGALVDRASAVLTNAMNKHVNAKTGAMGPPGSANVPATAAGNIMQIAQAAAQAEGVPWNANIVSTLLQKESGGGQNLAPHFYGGGLDPAGPFQVIGSTFQQYQVPGHPNRMNPFDNALAAFNYIRQRYHTLEGLASSTGLLGGGYHGYETGGRVNWAGWNARGGSFTTNGPTMFGAGEHGNREQVSITPVGRGNGRQIVVNMDHVTFNAGDPQQLEQVAQDVAGRIIAALDGTSGGTSDAQLAGAAS